MTSTVYSQPSFSPRLSRVGARLAALGASLGIVAGVVELTLGSQIHSWVGNKQDTTRLGLATITLSTIALFAAVTWSRRKDAAPGMRLLIVVGLIVPGLICFTTVGRAWYVPGALLVLAAGIAAAELREDASEVIETVSHNWLAALTVVLAGFYIFLGATALGAAGILGIVGGAAILILVALSARIPTGATALVLICAALPFALLTWWSVVTPLLGVLIVLVGWFALRNPAS